VHGAVRECVSSRIFASSRSLPVHSGAIVKKGKLDVTDEAGMAKFLLKVDGETAVECVLHLSRQSSCSL